jgi:hypothetical protein
VRRIAPARRTRTDDVKTTSVVFVSPIPVFGRPTLPDVSAVPVIVLVSAAAPPVPVVPVVLCVAPVDPVVSVEPVLPVVPGVKTEPVPLVPVSVDVVWACATATVLIISARHAKVQINILVVAFIINYF